MSNNERPTVNYYGEGVAELLKTGKKIVTLRKPNEKYNFEPGTEINAVCRDDEQIIPLMLIGNDTKVLADMGDPYVLLDGYAVPEIAAEDLNRYYEGFSLESKVQGLATIPAEMWDRLGSELQKTLLNIGVEVALEIPEFRQVFMPSLFFWFGTYEGADVHNWHLWSERQGLVTEQEIESKMSVDEMTGEYYRLAIEVLHGRLPSDLKNESSKAFQSVVLHQAISIFGDK